LFIYLLLSFFILGFRGLKTKLFKSRTERTHVKQTPTGDHLVCHSVCGFDPNQQTSHTTCSHALCLILPSQRPLAGKGRQSPLWSTIERACPQQST